MNNTIRFNRTVVSEVFGEEDSGSTIDKNIYIFTYDYMVGPRSATVEVRRVKADLGVNDGL